MSISLLMKLCTRQTDKFDGFQSELNSKYNGKYTDTLIECPIIHITPLFGPLSEKKDMSKVIS